MIAIAEPGVGKSVTLTVHGPTGVERVRLECLEDGAPERLKSLGYQWWRAPLVAFCRTTWGAGTLSQGSAAHEFVWDKRDTVRVP